jgi:hypothetical protein
MIDNTVGESIGQAPAGLLGRGDGGPGFRILFDPLYGIFYFFGKL